MLSLDPATVGSSGYGEIFQVGETLDGKPLVDRQHPHDFLMQLAATWRVAVRSDAHSRSPAARLASRRSARSRSCTGRRRRDCCSRRSATTRSTPRTSASASSPPPSTRGRWTSKDRSSTAASPTRIGGTSISARWIRSPAACGSGPQPSGKSQVSTGLLREPEALAPGDARAHDRVGRRGSARRPTDFTPSPPGYGVNAAHDEQRHGAFGEWTIERGANVRLGAPRGAAGRDERAHHRRDPG